MKAWMAVAGAIVCLTAPCGQARAVGDMLEFRNGQVVQGQYLGGSPNVVKFQTAQGVQQFSRQDVKAVVLVVPLPPPPTPASAPQVATVPAGSLLLVRMVSTVSSNDKAGTRFQAELQNNLEINGVMVAKAGAPVYGKVQESKKAGRVVGKASLQLALTEVSINGTLVPISTGTFSEAGEGSFKKTARGAAVGAVVGAVVDGGDGAAKGAGIGAAVSVLKKGESVTVPANAVLEFRLVQALTIGISQ